MAHNPFWLSWLDRMQAATTSTVANIGSARAAKQSRTMSRLSWQPTAAFHADLAGAAAALDEPRPLQARQVVVGAGRRGQVTGLHQGARVGRAAVVFLLVLDDGPVDGHVLRR